MDDKLDNASGIENAEIKERLIEGQCFGGKTRRILRRDVTDQALGNFRKLRLLFGGLDHQYSPAALSNE